MEYASSPKVWTEKLVTIEVNHMVREIGDPNLGFPDDIRRVFFETRKIHECRDIDA